MAELKKHLSLSEQVDKLVSRGVIVKDKAIAEELLHNVNYYRLSGYLFSFKKDGTDQYCEGVSLEKIKRIYDFDRKFCRILMFALEDIEETLKSRMSYCITSKHPEDPLIYLCPSIYRNYDQFIRFQGYFYTEVENNKNLPFVKHHLQCYDGKLPMWVAVELFTMGNLQAVFKNLNTPYQKGIARSYGTGLVQLCSWIENMTYVRNHLAHYMRIFRFNFGRTPMSCNTYAADFKRTGLVFDQIFVMSCMYSDINEWNNYILPDIKSIIDEYDEVELADIGFPENWEEILSKNK